MLNLLHFKDKGFIMSRKREGGERQKKEQQILCLPC